MLKAVDVLGRIHSNDLTPILVELEQRPIDVVSVVIGDTSTGDANQLLEPGLDGRYYFCRY